MHACIQAHTVTAIENHQGQVPCISLPDQYLGGAGRNESVHWAQDGEKPGKQEVGRLPSPHSAPRLLVRSLTHPQHRETGNLCHR